GCIFADTGPSLFLEKPDDRHLFALLGLLNSSLANLAMLALTPERRWEVGQVALLPVADSVLKSKILAEAARELHDLDLAWETGDEVSTRFVLPHILQVALPIPPWPTTGHPFAKSFTWPTSVTWRKIQDVRGSTAASLAQLLALVRERR